MSKVNVKCDYCGKTIKKWPCELKDNNYCSRECSNKANTKKGAENPSWKGGKVQKTCTVCGKTFEVYPYREDEAEFCSRDCARKSWSQQREEIERIQRIAKGVEKLEHMKAQLECDKCGKNIRKYPSEIYEHNFCSMECRSKWLGNKLKGENSPLWKSKIPKTCENCGSEFFVKPSREDARFCSHECYWDWRTRTDELSGENHYRWKSFENHNKWYTSSSRWRRVRKEALDRDNHTCQICGKNEELIVHHKTPVIEGGIHSLKNAVTLCKSCHGRLHALAGSKKNSSVLKLV